MSFERDIHRGFVELDDASIHYRYAGADSAHAPVVLVHASPASSQGLLPLIGALARDRRVVAPDTVGNGDSTGDIPPGADIGWFAERLAGALDALGLQHVDLYGTHTGASLATELALRQPQRVRSLVLDGVGLYPSELQRELLERYAPAVQPDLQGQYLTWIWHFVRDTYLFWPWYRLDAGHRRVIGLPGPDVLHDKVVEVLKAARTYHHSYRAAIAYDKRANIPQLRVPTLAVCAREDMLAAYFEELVALVPGGKHAWVCGSHTPEAAQTTADVLRSFFADVHDR